MKNLRDVPIRRKLVLIIFAISLVVMLLTGGAFLVFEYLTFRQTTVRQLTTVGEILAANSTAALAFQNQDDASEILAALKSERHVVAAALYDRDGKLFSRYPADFPADALPAAPGEPGLMYVGTHIAGFIPVVELQPLGTLFLRYDTKVLLQQWLRGLIQIALVVMSLFLVVAYALSRVLQKQISRPIVTLAETARAISERRDYSVRAHKLGEDELGLLTDAFIAARADSRAEDRARRTRHRRDHEPAGPHHLRE